MSIYSMHVEVQVVRTSKHTLLRGLFVRMFRVKNRTPTFQPKQELRQEPLDQS